MEQMGGSLFKKSRSKKTDMNRQQLTLIITAGDSGDVVTSKLLELMEEEFQPSEYHSGLVQMIAVNKRRLSPWRSEGVLEPVELAPLSEGVKSAELAIKEWKMAKEYIEKKKHH